MLLLVVPNPIQTEETQRLSNSNRRTQNLQFEKRKANQQRSSISFGLATQAYYFFSSKDRKQKFFSILKKLTHIYGVWEEKLCCVPLWINQSYTVCASTAKETDATSSNMFAKYKKKRVIRERFIEKKRKKLTKVSFR